MKGVRAALIALAATGLAACGSGGATNPTASPSAPAGATASSEKYIVVADPSPYSGQTPSTVRFYTLNGQEVGHVVLATNSQVAAIGGARVFVLGTDGKLRAYHRDGSTEELGVIDPTAPFAASPDGRMWAWATSTAQGDMVSSAIHVAGDGLSARVVETATESVRSLRPYEWTSLGLFIEHGAMGIGGYIPYIEATGPVDEIDTQTFSVKPIQTTNSCSFSDLAPDGTLACFPNPSPQHTLRIVYPDGRSTDIPLSTPRFNLYGDAYFSPDGTRITLGGAEGTGTLGTSSSGERYGTDLVQTSDGSIARISLGGVRPASFQRGQCWLTDHSLLVYRPENSADGQGVYVYDTAGGSSTLISKTGVPLGAVSS